MAPRKRSSEEAAALPVTTRVTRSSARGGGAAAAPPPPKPKKRATKKEKIATHDVSEGKVTPVEGEKGPVAGKGGRVADVANGGSKARTVVIEHCKQCNAFKTRAFQVKAGLENGVPGIIVLLNPEKPRRGCFEIREEGGEKFITLLNMPRPFKPMKELDMDKVISDIIDKIK